MADEQSEQPGKQVTDAPELELREKRMAARALRRILDDLGDTRQNFVLGAVYTGSLFLLSVCFLIFAEQEDDSARMVAMVTGPAFVVMVVGYKLTVLYPFFWNIVVAVVVSALAAVSIYKGDIQHVILAIAVVLWINVFISYVRTRRILREYPDMRISMNYVARDGKVYRDPVRPRGRVARRLAVREEADRARSHRSIFIVSILAAIAVAILTTILLMS